MTTPCHRYSVPAAPGLSWAILFLDGAGCFAAISEHGTLGHRWNMRGVEGDFRAFLLDCDDPYMIGKLSNGRKVYDAKATRQAVEEHLADQGAELEEERKELEADERGRLSDLLPKGQHLPDRLPDAFWRSSPREDVGRYRVRRARLDHEKELLDLLTDSTATEAFAQWHERTCLDEAYEYHRATPPREVLEFVKTCWPRLRELIRAELASEKPAAPR